VTFRTDEGAPPLNENASVETTMVPATAAGLAQWRGEPELHATATGGVAGTMPDPVTRTSRKASSPG
jgi:hypothetical protein